MSPPYIAPASGEFPSLFQRASKLFTSSYNFPEEFPAYSTELHRASATPAALSTPTAGSALSVVFKDSRLGHDGLDNKQRDIGGFMLESSSYEPSQHAAEQENLLQQHQFPEFSADSEESSSVTTLNQLVSAAAPSRLGESLCDLPEYVANSDVSAGVLADVKLSHDCSGGMKDYVLNAARNASASLTPPRGEELITWDSSADCGSISYTGHVVIGIVIIVIAVVTALGNLLVLCTFFSLPWYYEATNHGTMKQLACHGGPVMVPINTSLPWYYEATGHGGPSVWYSLCPEYWVALGTNTFSFKMSYGCTSRPYCKFAENQFIHYAKRSELSLD
ncbi:hypothetical protein PoB_005004600 [Plakobranchus ocellatus]|uniref:Uncharacterized protein n=1 Tax=Plakobranchus ocellatus TaxID=259542 RepID=A0AAV4BSU5_9GAST|nr:hypothetical protein PoB_005004600 [Plakobranchus ocellatus]